MIGSALYLGWTVWRDEGPAKLQPPPAFDILTLAPWWAVALVVVTLIAGFLFEASFRRVGALEAQIGDWDEAERALKASQESEAELRNQLAFVQSKAIGNTQLEQRMLHSLWENNYAISKRDTVGDETFNFVVLGLQEGFRARAFHIKRSAATPRILDLESDLVLPADARRAFSALSSEQKRAMLSELSIELASLQGNFADGIEDPLASVRIKRRVVMDNSFNEDTFYMRDLASVAKGIDLALAIVGKYLPEFAQHWADDGLPTPAARAANALFAAHAREDVPYLLARLSRLEAAARAFVDEVAPWATNKDEAIEDVSEALPALRAALAPQGEKE